MNLFKQDAKAPTAKHRQVASTVNVDSLNSSSPESNEAPVAKVYMDAKPHKDLLRSSNTDSQLHSKDVQVAQGAKQ